MAVAVHSRPSTAIDASVPAEGTASGRAQQGGPGQRDRGHRERDALAGARIDGAEPAVEEHGPAA